MRPSFLLALGAVAVVACDANPGPVNAYAHRAAALTPSPPAPSNAEACVGDRWVGTVSAQGSPCPPSPASPYPDARWKGGRLFSSPTLGPALGAYCVYDWERDDAAAPAPDPTLLPFDGNFPPSKWLAEDCLTVSPLGPLGPTASALNDALYAGFLPQATLAAPLPATADGPKTVNVAVVDTSPDSALGGAPVVGRSEHGYAMGRLVDDLTCPRNACTGAPDPNCSVAPLTFLGLPLANTPDGVVADRVQGGFFGRQTDLALGIFKAIETWLAQDIAKRPARLVINLSVGWEPQWGGDFAGPAPGAGVGAPTRAVFDALTHASCFGAANIAAAGNDPGGPSRPKGPMYPGGWETKPAPTGAICAAFEGDGAYAKRVAYPPISPPGVYAPLVYAVGGVDAGDAPIINGREGGRPRLAAPAALAAAHTYKTTLVGQPGGATTTAFADSSTGTFTGTSVASAVTSAALSLVWAYRPNLTPGEAMDLVYGAGADLTSSSSSRPHADFCLDGTPCAGELLRRVSVCDALVAACEGADGGCPGLGKCAAIGPYAGSAPSFSATTTDALATALDEADVSHAMTDIDAPVVIDSPCGGDVFNQGASPTPDNACPDRQFYTALISPWVDPQPDSGGGPTGPGTLLTFNTLSHGRATLSFSVTNAVSSPTDVSLVVVLRSGARDTYPLTTLTGAPRAGQAYVVDDIALPSYSRLSVSGALLTFAYAGTTRESASSTPIAINWQ